MEFVGSRAAGDRMRILSAMQKYSWLFGGKTNTDLPVFEVHWAKKMFKEKNYNLDQTECYSEIFDYEKNFLLDLSFESVNIPTKMWRYDHMRHELFKNYQTEGDDFFKRNYVWLFRNEQKRKKNKVVFWRSTLIDSYNIMQKDVSKAHHSFLNIRSVNTIKRPLSQESWTRLKDFLSEHFDVVEIEYRTPIREVMYHLFTCEFCFGYGGMWNLHAHAAKTPQITLMNNEGFYYANPSHLIGNPFYISGYDRGIFPNSDVGNANSMCIIGYKIEELLNIELINNVLILAKQVNKDIQSKFFKTFY